VPDFPKPGIGFKDIMPLVLHPEPFNYTIDRLSEWARPLKPDVIVGIEARGYLFAAPVARDLRLGVSVIRKKGKLPRKTVCVQAPNEYAMEFFEKHEDALNPGQRVIVIDDLIATGSSSISALQLVKMLKANPVGFGAVVDLAFLNGIPAIKKAHPQVDLFHLVRYA
ncbi:MAG: adenine phosphoribosyltransferase, partial [Candidatus Aminicenantes bacterium]|nr:adenine phosphoribosyltransferase [Candidatus Aminicenantes bacterium]